MDRRLLLHEELCSILGSRNVYFQPPESIKLEYPCIIYKRYNGSDRYADDIPYNFRFVYQVTLIERDPDSERVKKLALMPRCRYDRHFASDNLNHDVFVIYY